jgi:hypothetical protein
MLSPREIPLLGLKMLDTASSQRQNSPKNYSFRLVAHAGLVRCDGLKLKLSRAHLSGRFLETNETATGSNLSINRSSSSNRGAFFR